MTKKLNPIVKELTKTLRRIPKETFLSIASQEFNMHDCDTCLCGNAIRTDLIRMTGNGNNEYDYFDKSEQCRLQFGGTYDEWHNIFAGVLVTNNGNVDPDDLNDMPPYYTHSIERIEEAFIRRLNECVP